MEVTLMKMTPGTYFFVVEVSNISITLKCPGSFHFAHKGQNYNLKKTNYHPTNSHFVGTFSQTTRISLD